MKKTATQIISCWLSILMLLSMLPTAAFAVSDVKSVKVNTADATEIVYGGQHWRVIGYNGSGVASEAGTMTLLAKDNIGNSIKFHDANNEESSNDYAASNLKPAVENIYEGFTAVEKTAVATRTLEVGTYSENVPYCDGVATTQVDHAALWPLSTAEANGVDIELRKANDFWWLRSPGKIAHGSNNVANVVNGGTNNNGYLDSFGYYPTENCGVRPAFKLNLSSVLFTSAAENGKSETAGTMTAVAAPDAVQKLTIVDSVNLDAGNVTATGADTNADTTITVSTTDATSEKALSAIITDSTGEQVNYYGKIADIDSSGLVADANLTLPVTLGEENVLKIIAEELSGDNVTDYASSPVAVTVAVAPPAPSDITPPNLTAGEVSRTSDTEATVKFTSDEAGQYYYNIGSAVTDTSEEGTVCDTNAQTITLTNLQAGEQELYLVVKDEAGNVSENTFHMTIPACKTSTDESISLDTTVTTIESGKTYTIANKEQLVRFATLVNDGQTCEGATIQLLNDIALNDTSDWENWDTNAPTYEWTAIGKYTYESTTSKPFKGTFDGGGHTISGIYINKSTQDYQGLFGYAEGGTIQNVSVDESYIKGQHIVGGIVAETKKSTVENCDNNGNVSGSNDTGGVVGTTGYGTVENCYNTGNVTSDGRCVGGIVGENGYNSAISNCYNTGSISNGSGENVGGIAGKNSQLVKTCYNIGRVSGTGSNVGGIAGENSYIVKTCYNIGRVSGTGSNVGGVVGSHERCTEVENCYYDKQMCPLTASNAEDKLTSELVGTSLESVFGTDNWVYEDGMYPRLKDRANTDLSIVSATPVFLVKEETIAEVTQNFTLGTKNNVEWESDNENAISINEENASVLASDADGLVLTAKRNNVTKMVKLNKVTGPIALEDTVNTIESGNTYTIENKEQLEHFRDLVNDGQTCKGAKIELLKNIALGCWRDDNGNNEIDDGEIYDYESDGTAYTQSNWIPIGTDSGYNHSRDIPFQGTFDGKDHTISGIYLNEPSMHVGGLFGLVKGAKISNLGITESYIYCNNSVGGIVGHFMSPDSEKDTGIVENCYNAAKISGIGGIGGIVGELHRNNSIDDYNATIKNCFNIGTILGQNLSGGIVGSGQRTKIETCYNAGNVATPEGDRRVYNGGIIGRAMSVSRVENCYNVGTVLNGSAIISDNTSGFADDSYFDQQMSRCIHGSNDGLHTNEMLGNGLAEKLGTENWVYEDGMYPRLKGMEHTDAAKLSATPINLSTDDETVWMLRNDFTVGTKNGVSWKSNNTEVIGLDGENASVLAGYENEKCDALMNLNARLGDVTKTVYIERVVAPIVIKLTSKVKTINSGMTYTIENKEQLEHFADLVNNGQTCKGAKIKLLSNIALGYWCDDNEDGIEDANEIYDSQSGGTAYTESNWTAIGNSTTQFKGIFDGGNYTISGIYINEPDSNHQGLFGYIDGGTIKKVSVTESYIQGNSFVGGIVGQAKGTNATVANCCNAGHVIGEGNVGGIIGWNNNATASNCYNTGNVSGNSYSIGGIAGYNIAGTVSNCYNAGNVNGTGDYVGGVVGKNNNGTVCNCYNIDSVNGSGEYIGSVVGGDEYGTISYCVYDKQMHPIVDSNAEGKLTSEMVGTSLQEALGSDNWVYEDGMYPRLNGMENTTAAYVSTTPVFLAGEETVEGVIENFTLGTKNTVTWESSAPATVKITNSNATVTQKNTEQTVTLTATCEDASRTVVLTVPKGKDVPPAIKYIVTVNGGTGGGEYPESATVTISATVPSGKVFKNWTSTNGITFANANSAETTFAMPAKDVTVTANFGEKTFALSGTVTRSDSPANGATVVLKQGKQEIKQTITNASDQYSFTDLTNGVYNLVVTKDEKIVTSLIIIKNADVTQDVTLPAENKDSILEVTGTDTPAVVVGGLDAVAEEAPESQVVIKMTVKKKAEDEAQNADAIKKASSGKQLDFLDMKVSKSTDGTTEKPLSKVEKVLEIVIPYDFSGKSDVTVYRYHGTSVDTFTKLTEKPAALYSDGTFYMDEINGFLYVYAQKFSTYAVGYQTATQKTITLDANGGTVSPDTMLTNEAGKLDRLPTPTRSGRYDFDGWYTEKDEGTKVTTGTVFGADTTIYAQWTYQSSSSGGGGSSHHYYDIKIKVKGEGSISPDGGSDHVLRVRERNDQSFTIKATEGYEIYNVLVDGKSVGAVDEYTLENIRDDHSIQAVFQKESSAKENDPFTDVTEEDWFYDEVLMVFEEGIMAGTSESKFSPYLGTSRGMIATILHRLEQKPDYRESNPFHDVSENEWYTDGIAWCAQHGIVKGYGEGIFKPNQIITREELCAILSRYAEYKGLDVTKQADLSEFVDQTQIADWAKDSVRFAVGAELMQGNDQHQFCPKNQATRAEVAAVICNLLQLTES